MYHSNRLRIGRISVSGQIYLITTVCHLRKPIFAEYDHARWAVHSLKQTSMAVDTLCFVVMPDHVHWLLQLKDSHDLSSVVRFFKAQTTRYMRKECLLDSKLWQKGFHDRQIRKEEDLVAVARYVVANPIRAGLVKSVREYSFWDAIWL